MRAGERRCQVLFALARKTFRAAPVRDWQSNVLGIMISSSIVSAFRLLIARDRTSRKGTRTRFARFAAMPLEIRSCGSAGVRLYSTAREMTNARVCAVHTVHITYVPSSSGLMRAIETTNQPASQPALLLRGGTVQFARTGA